MKYLIVNGDDFGASPGINRGILEAHSQGILTSTSLMVDMPSCEQAVSLARGWPDLSVGLHFQLTAESGEWLIHPDRTEACHDELRRQLRRFHALAGHAPTHIDSHHNVHREPRLLPLFLDLAHEHGLPLREHSPARYFSNFYGQWDGETHLEWIGVENLLRLLEDQVREGVTELGCHPGYTDPHFQSSYASERETELRTLCDPQVRAFLREKEIRLITFREIGRLGLEANRMGAAA